MLNLQAYGRIASDIIVKESKNNKHLYTNFLLASHGSNKETTFIRCVAFDGLATLLHEFFCKGDRVIFKGELISDNYNGNKFVFKMLIKDFEFVETKKDHLNNKTKERREKDG